MKKISGLEKFKFILALSNLLLLIVSFVLLINDFRWGSMLTMIAIASNIVFLLYHLKKVKND